MREARESSFFFSLAYYSNIVILKTRKKMIFGYIEVFLVLTVVKRIHLLLYCYEVKFHNFEEIKELESFQN